MSCPVSMPFFETGPQKAFASVQQEADQLGPVDLPGVDLPLDEIRDLPLTFDGSEVTKTSDEHPAGLSHLEDQPFDAPIYITNITKTFWNGWAQGSILTSFAFPRLPKTSPFCHFWITGFVSAQYLGGSAKSVISSKGQIHPPGNPLAPSSLHSRFTSLNAALMRSGL